MNPPYLFVAHSLGGIFANLYACTYTDEVSGIVFVDAAHPLERTEQQAHKPPPVVRTINEGFKAIEKLFDKFTYSEDECIEQTIAQIQNAASFPDIPIAVVTGTRKMPLVPMEAFEIHQRYQEKLLELSPKSAWYRCEKSGHFPQITEPEKVVSAIMDTINETKSS